MCCLCPTCPLQLQVVVFFSPHFPAFCKCMSHCLLSCRIFPGSISASSSCFIDNCSMFSFLIYGNMFGHKFYVLHTIFFLFKREREIKMCMHIIYFQRNPLSPHPSSSLVAKQRCVPSGGLSLSLPSVPPSIPT